MPKRARSADSAPAALRVKARHRLPPLLNRKGARCASRSTALPTTLSTECSPFDAIYVLAIGLTNTQRLGQPRNDVFL